LTENTGSRLEAHEVRLRGGRREKWNRHLATRSVHEHAQIRAAVVANCEAAARWRPNLDVGREQALGAERHDCRQRDRKGSLPEMSCLHGVSS
jgi:hypothetical protein